MSEVEESIGDAGSMSKESYLTWMSKGGLFEEGDSRTETGASLLNASAHLYEHRQHFTARTPTSTQISNVVLSDFKSVAAAHVALGPLSIVVGRNSSGKSSLIQSILLATQHLTNKYANDRKISLNQHLVRLGTFSQVHRRGATSPHTVIGFSNGFGASWSVTIGEDAQNPKSRNAAIVAISGERARKRDDLSFRIDDIATPQITYPTIFPGRRVVAQSEICSARYEIKASKVAEPRVFSYALFPDTSVSSGQPLPLEEMDLLTSLAYLMKAHASVGVDDQSEHSKLVKVNKSDFSRVLHHFAGIVFDEAVTDSTEELISKINNRIELNADEFEELALTVQALAFGFSVDDVLERACAESNYSIHRFKANAQEFSIGDIRELLWNTWTTTLKSVESPTVLVPLSVGNRYEELANVNLSLTMFRESMSLPLWGLYHVGPIRDPESPADPISDPLYVGPKGEQTMEILQREGSRRVFEPMSKKMMSFTQALSEVLKVLELADDAKVEERGRERPGISMVPFHDDGQAVEAEESSELNAVGVGVSQILPVIMQCLLAEPGRSVVVVEQPELHLHPRLEQKLADFFLACATSGRQVIIETHSEHLINRLRLRIAEDQDDEVRQIVKFVFAEQRDGVTTYREPSIDRFGNAEIGESNEDWPDGFLDLTLEEARRLLSAANDRRIAEIEKRKAEIETRVANRVLPTIDDDDFDDDDD